MKTFILSTAFSLLSIVTLAQATVSGNTENFSSDFLGWDNSTAWDLKVSHDGAYNIDFWTNGSQNMTLTSGGNLGIGTASPTQLLDVNGNINVSSTNSYRINGVRQLYVRGTNNLMVGNSGNTTLSANNNVVVGNGAGTSLTAGEDNVFIGVDAGAANLGVTGPY
jgi:hypothetical protein